MSTSPQSRVPAIAPTVRLDYMMVGPDLVPSIKSCRIGDVDRALLVSASDHLPLVAEFDL